mgnify:FL=1|jgi:uncharacterized integral membrane protein (TIGR00698 family)
MTALKEVFRSFRTWLVVAAPGLGIVTAATGVALWTTTVSSVSAGAVALGVGLLFGNLAPGQERAQVGLAFASRRVLRVGVVLLGFRLSVGELRQNMGLLDVLAVIGLVVLTLWGVNKIARALGLSSDFGRLLGVGYAVCGVSAIAAVKPLTKADDEEVAYAVGLVTLFGTLSMALYPTVAAFLDITPDLFGWWAGSAIHDVAQVVATATISGDVALETAVVVKLGRVALLGPILIFLSLRERKQDAVRGGIFGLVPLFVLGFIAAVAVRSSGLIPTESLDVLDTLRKICLTAAMVGVGALVKFRNLASMGGRPLKVGVISWVLLAVVALTVSRLVALA